MQRIGMGEHADADRRQRKGGDEICGQWRVAGTDRRSANARGENEKAERDAAQENREGYSGARSDFADLADRLTNVIVALNRLRQIDDAEGKKSRGQRTEQQAVVPRHAESPWSL